MFFRRKSVDPHVEAWDAFAARLELEDAAAVAERLRRWLDLGDVDLEHVYALRRDDQPTLYVFEYRRERAGPTGAVQQRTGACLLRSDSAFAPLAFRAHPKRNRVMESLEASRTGTSPVTLPGACSERITIFARHENGAEAHFRGPVCATLDRALQRPGAVSVVVGERHVLASCDTSEAPLETLEALASDVLALYAALAATGA